MKYLYGFFDYKYDLIGFESDIYSLSHIIFLILAFVSLGFVAYFVRGAKKKNVEVFIRVLAIFVTVLEVAKLSWESYFDVTRGQGINFFGIAPIYTCSLLIYCSLIAGFAKGKAKDICLSWLCTIGMMTGLITLFYPTGLNWYPVLTFGGMHTLLFHYGLVLCAVVCIASGYKKLQWKDILISMIPMLALAILVIPVNYAIKSDYMQVYEAAGVPVLHDFATMLASHGLRWLFTIIMLSSYMVLSSIVVAPYQLVTLLKAKTKKEKEVVVEVSE